MTRADTWLGRSPSSESFSSSKRRRLQPFDKIKSTYVVPEMVDVVSINRYYGWYYDHGELPVIYDQMKEELNRWHVRFGKPILPITMSFRARRGLYRLFSKKPSVDLHIGEPIFPDTTLPVHEAAEKMQKTAYRVMQEMNGIREGDPTYNTDLVISHYKKTM